MRPNTSSDSNEGSFSHDHSGLRPLRIPEKYCRHPLVKDRVFFTLPADLLGQLFLGSGATAFGSLEKDMELDLSSVMGDHTHTVGFWRNQPVVYGHLRQRKLTDIRLDAATLQKLGWELTVEKANANLQTAESRLSRMSEIAQGYAGWLTTNPAFVQEKDDLLRQFASQVNQWGIPNLTGPPRLAVREEATPAEPALTTCCEKFQEFCIRWRLAGLAAPNLPLPLQPQTPALGLALMTGPLTEIGSVFYLPDTYPVPSRDELRDILEDSLRGSGTASHLSEWTELVRGGNPAKNQIPRFGRIFELQHYWRILHERHAQAIRGRLGDLKFAIAEFLGTSSDSIHGDLIFIRKRLGEDWVSRGNNSALENEPAL